MDELEEQEKAELREIVLEKIKEKKILGSDERRHRLMETILKEIGNKEVPASDIYINGYDDVEIYQALMYLKLLGLVKRTGFHTIVREDGGLFSVGIYKKIYYNK